MSALAITFSLLGRPLVWHSTDGNASPVSTPAIASKMYMRQNEATLGTTLEGYTGLIRAGRKALFYGAFSMPS